MEQLHRGSVKLVKSLSEQFYSTADRFCFYYSGAGDQEFDVENEELEMDEDVQEEGVLD